MVKSTALFCRPEAVYSRTMAGASAKKSWRGVQPSSRFALSAEAKKCVVLHARDSRGEEGAVVSNNIMPTGLAVLSPGPVW